MTKKWIANDGGIDTEAGETVLCHEYDWATGETKMFYSKRFKAAVLAAPALLEALEALLAVEGIIDPTDDECAATQSAIDKATAAIKLSRGEP